MAEAIVDSTVPGEAQRTAPAALTSAEVLQDFDGKAGVVVSLNAVASADQFTLCKEGVFRLPKTASTVMLAGGRAYWDRATSKVTWNKYTTGVFYIGTVHADAASADADVYVNLNARQHNKIQSGEGAWDNVVVLTAGTVKPNVNLGVAGTDPGGTLTRFTFSATAEAQKVDMMSRATIAVVDGPIFEAVLAVFDIGDNAALDINIGLANGTHATDADSITESVFFHLDGTSLNINAESDDGTTEVASTDTTIDAVDDTYFEVWIDARTPAGVKLYINAVRALSSSTFVLTAATGPLKALFHMEKTSDDTPADVRVEFMNVRSTDLA